MTSDDVTAIRNLIYSYATLFDLGEFAQAAALFEHASVRVTELGEPALGDDVPSLLTGHVLTYDGLPRTKHVIGNVVINVDQVRATAESYFVAMQALPDFALQPILAGRWHDALEKTADSRWRFVDRIIHPDLMGDLSRHIRGRK